MVNVRLSYFHNGTGIEVLEENNYYPFGLKHSGYNTGDNTNNKFKYLYNSKELQSNGNLDYGWRQYMPDLGRWNGMDQLAEAYESTSPYAYVANNPVSKTDPDGRWIYEDGSIGQAPATWDMHGPKYKPYLSYNMSNGIATNLGAEVLGGYTFTGDAAVSMFEYFANGGNMSGISFNNGYAIWGTLEGDPSHLGYDGEMYLGDTGGVTLHSAKIINNTSWDSYKNWADYGSGTIGTIYKAIADQRTSLYGRGYWIDNLGNQRSIRYAGRAVDSQIGLRSTYLRTTAKFGKYAKGAGYVGYALSAYEVGEGLYKDGWRPGKNTVVAGVKVGTGLAVTAGVSAGATWFTGAIAGAVGGSVAPGVGTVIGFIAGAVAGYYASEYVGEAVENSYK